MANWNAIFPELQEIIVEGMPRLSQALFPFTSGENYKKFYDKYKLGTQRVLSLAAETGRIELCEEVCPLARSLSLHFFAFSI